MLHQYFPINERMTASSISAMDIMVFVKMDRLHTLPAFIITSNRPLHFRTGTAMMIHSYSRSGLNDQNR